MACHQCDRAVTPLPHLQEQNRLSRAGKTMIMAEQALLIQILLTCDLRNWPCLSRCAFDLDQIEALYQMDLPPRPAHERPNRIRSKESAVRSAHLPFPDKENCRCLVLGTIQHRVLTERRTPPNKSCSSVARRVPPCAHRRSGAHLGHSYPLEAGCELLQNMRRNLGTNTCREL
jgi:hypothetical protein